jgi:flagellar biosynthetic protein FlhB
MSEKDTAERTEQPTPKKLDDARKKGQVPRSVDVGAAAVSLTAVGMLFVFGSSIAESLGRVMIEGLTVSQDDLLNVDITARSFAFESLQGMLAIAPLLGATFIAAILAPALIGGWNFSSEAMGFKANRINPLSGFARMFSARSAVELFKSIAKFVFVGGVGVFVLSSQTDRLLHLAQQPVTSAILSVAEITAFATLAMAATLIVIALIDGPFQLWKFLQEMRMSREDIKQEYKDSDGSPETRSRIRAAQSAMARGRMMQDVPDATVVVTNPTHFAVALRYDEQRNGAPIVVAKGADEVAARIREIASQHGVPLVSAPPLARAMFRYIDVGREIPSPLYLAVAKVLTYVWQMRAAVAQGSDKPTLPQIDPAIEFFGDRRGEPLNG